MAPKIALAGVGGGGINFAKIGIASLDSLDSLGFGDQVEVLKPVRLRKNFAEIASNMARDYSQPE